MLHAILHLAPWGQVPVVSPKTLLSTQSKSCWYQAKQAHVHGCHERLWTRHSCHCRLHPKKETSRLLVRKPFKSVNLKIFEYWIMKWIWPSVSFLYFPGECWDGALQLLAEMPDAADLTAFGAAVSCCERRWVEALQVLHDMQYGGELLVDYVDWGGWCCQWTFWVSMLCGVNSPAGQKDVEYKHLDATNTEHPWMFLPNSPHPLLLAGLQPNLIVCSAAIAACEKGRGFIVRLLRKNREKLQIFEWRISKKILQ